MATPLKGTKLPLVSIVIPVFNDEEYIARALDSAINQSLKNIEIICVDDCSTDNTVKIIESYVKKDSRVHLVQQEKNASAFQARYKGIVSAKASYILFLDGDDELHQNAAKLTYAQAVQSNSDIVGFGPRILRENGSISRDFENSLQPTHKKLVGSDIVAHLFTPNVPAQGHMWRYLFSKELLQKAYSYFPEGQQIHRVNDLPISFLAAALAKKYTSIPHKLYTYHFYAGGSGGTYFDIDKFKFYTKAVESINLLQTIVAKDEFSQNAKDSYYSARISVLSNILRQIESKLPVIYHKEAVDFLLTKVGLDEISAALANYMPEALPTIQKQLTLIKPTKKSKNVAVYTNNLGTGGVQAVAVSQAKYLHDAGYNVSIIILNNDSIAFDIPNDIKVIYVKRGNIYLRLRDFKTVLEQNNIDTIIDHNVLYNMWWPYFNLVAKSLGIKTLAWIHSFSLRPVLDGSLIGQYLNENIHLIDDLVVLSKADVSYWKSIGHQNVFCLPNPPSPLLLNSHTDIKPKEAPEKHLQILWYGRLQERTKKVYSLIDIAVELKKLTSTFTLNIVGPDSEDLAASEVKERIKANGLEANVKVIGPKHGEALVAEIKNADVFLSTSIIEGYLLTLVEAQSYGLPTVMYELPWLATVEGNKGVLQTPQKKPALAAEQLFALFTDKELYEKTSKASIEASRSNLDYNFPELYTHLLEHSLPKKFSPEIDKDHMGMIIKWTQFYLAEYLLKDSGVESIKRKNEEILALKNSKAMKVGNAVAKPLRTAKILKHKVAKHLKK